jgi:hypothetical protein
MTPADGILIVAVAGVLAYASGHLSGRTSERARWVRAAEQDESVVADGKTYECWRSVDDDLDTEED